MIRMKMRGIVLTLILVQTILTLHTQSHSQLPQRYDEKAYLEGLQARQNKLQ
jgi:hypothetical protein